MPHLRILSCHDVERAVLQGIATDCQISEDQIEDVYACTPLQAGIMADSIEHRNGGIYQAIFSFSPSFDIDGLSAAISEFVRLNPIARTRIVDSRLGVVQVVVREDHRVYRHSRGLDEYLEQIRRTPMHLAAPLFRSAIIEQRLVLSMHHAIFDQSSIEAAIRDIVSIHDGKTPESHAPFKAFVEHCLNVDDSAAKEFWNGRFRGLSTIFPAVEGNRSAIATETITRRLDSQRHAKDIPTSLLPSYIEAAWALTTAAYTGSEDIAYGFTMSGRSGTLTELETTLGPTVLAVPVQVALREDTTIESLLKDRSRERRQLGTNHALYWGLPNIRSISEEARSASNFQTLLNIRSHAPGSNLPAGIEFEDEEAVVPPEPRAISLVFTLQSDCVLVTASFDSSVLCEQQMDRIWRQFDHIFQLLVTSPQQCRIKELQLTSLDDRLEVFDWNAKVPTLVAECVDQMFSAKAGEQPDTIAIKAFDGDLTYQELDAFSDYLACDLKRKGASEEDCLPFVFEKSSWTIVAILAILKIGASAVPIEPSYPRHRKELIVSSTKARTLVTSATEYASSSGLAPEIVEVSRASLSKLPKERFQTLSNRSPRQAAYVMFTSGSTGTPKGVVLDHFNLASSIMAFAHQLNMAPGRRVLQFASYVWDASILEVFGALAFGGCICIPSNEVRLAGLAEFIRYHQVNWALLTPTVHRMISPLDVPCLETLVSGGEAIGPGDAAKWGSTRRFYNAWGLCETGGASTAQELTPNSSFPESIGTPVGSVIWIVSTDDVNTLVPIGAVGELIVEGPSIARCYLNDDVKTKERFIKAPAWAPLRRKNPKYPRRFYRSGDLAKYNPDGSICFIGRLDKQIKLRGQRFELGEVESSLSTSPMIRDIIAIVSEITLGHEVLVVVATLSEPTTLGRECLKEVPKTSKQVQEIRCYAQSILPSYMVPSIYLIVEQMPRTDAMKIDQVAVQRWLGGKNMSSVHTLNGDYDYGALTPPTTPAEKVLQRVWAAVLSVPEDQIGCETSFSALGGDSISGMQVATRCRKHGLRITMAALLHSQNLSNAAMESESLCEQTAAVAPTDVPIDPDPNGMIHRSDVENKREIMDSIPPYSLLDKSLDVEKAKEQVELLCGVDKSQVEDIMPCTALQEGLLAMASKRTGDYVSQSKNQLRHDINIDRFKQAWATVVEKTPIMRTRIVDIQGKGLMQVVLRGKVEWTQYEDHVTGLDAGYRREMTIGTPLQRFGLYTDVDNTHWFIWTVHHALYDGWSIALLMETLEQAYESSSIPSRLPFSHFIEHIISNGEHSDAFWKEQFAGLEAQQFPSLPSTTYQPQTDENFVYSMELPETSSPQSFSTQTIMRAAWAALIAQYTDSSDAVFGAVVSGRQANLAGVDLVAGPTIATVPIRIKLDRDITLEDFLRAIQNQASDMIAYEQTGLQKIRHVSNEAEVACLFQSLLLLQWGVEENFTSSLFQSSEATRDQDNAFGTYAIILQCERQEGRKLLLRFNFDSEVIRRPQVVRLAEQLQHLVHQMCTVEKFQMKLRDVMGISKTDLQDIWSWNAEIPEAVDACVHETIFERAKTYFDAPAICAWDGSFTYGELDEYSTSLAHQLIDHGVGRGVIVPICLEKSRWTTVAALAVFKAGGTACMMDISLPQGRLRSFIEQAAPIVVLASPSQRQVASQISSVPIVEVIAESIDCLATIEAERSLPAVGPSDSLYVVFTSGSTGTPKVGF